MGKCAANPSWQRTQIVDKRLGRSAQLELSPESWIVKWSLFSIEDGGCRSEVRVSGVDQKHEWKQESSLPKQYTKPDQYPIVAGAFDFAMSVVDESGNSFEEPSGNALQVQVLVFNRSEQTRVVAVVDRTLRCAPGTDLDWVIGPGEGPAELSAGPVLVPPREWIAFSNRIRGRSSSQGCHITMELAEIRAARSDPYLPPAWHSIGKVEGPMRASVRARYLN